MIKTGSRSTLYLNNPAFVTEKLCSLHPKIIKHFKVLFFLCVDRKHFRRKEKVRVQLGKEDERIS